MRLPFLAACKPCSAACAILLTLCFQFATQNSSAAVTEKPKTSVADLRYGVALYHYYQQDYLPSLSELMVASARDGIHGHGDNPLLINGGVSLAFGMQDHAEHIFTQLLQDNQRPQSVRDAAWFYLGKLYYTRADWQAAEQSFNKVSAQFNPDLLAELRALRINVQIKKNQFSAITAQEIQQQTLGAWQAFALYNLFVAHTRAGDSQTAQPFLRELEKISPDTSSKHYREYVALRDKTHTAVGYSLLQEKNYSNAAEQFNKVSLDGVASSQALLGYGWAAMAQENYGEAIKAWQVLKARSLLQVSAQESLVALPFAYEKLNANGDALREYQRSEKLLQQELALVTSMRTALTPRELLSLIASKPNRNDVSENSTPRTSTLSAEIVDDGQNWLKINSTSILKTRSLYLRELFATNAFQTQALELRDLLALQTLLASWQPKLREYTELLQQKQRVRQQQELTINQKTLSKKVAELQRQRDDLLARLTIIKANTDYIALADDQLKTTYQKIQALHQLHTSAQGDPHDGERLRLLRGVVLWRAAEHFPGAVIENEAAIDSIDSNLAKIARSDKHIQQITATGLDLQPLFARLQHQQKQLEVQREQVDAVIASKAAVLRDQVAEQLVAHEKRLNRYLAQTHLAVARLYDAELRKSAP